jgi:hypothetical protein
MSDSELYSRLLLPKGHGYPADLPLPHYAIPIKGNLPAGH